MRLKSFHGQNLRGVKWFYLVHVSCVESIFEVQSSAKLLYGILRFFFQICRAIGAILKLLRQSDLQLCGSMKSGSKALHFKNNVSGLIKKCPINSSKMDGFDRVLRISFEAYIVKRAKLSWNFWQGGDIRYLIKFNVWIIHCIPKEVDVSKVFWWLIGNLHCFFEQSSWKSGRGAPRRRCWYGSWVSFD